MKLRNIIHSEKYIASLAKILNVTDKTYRCFFFVSAKKLSAAHRIYSNSILTIAAGKFKSRCQIFTRSVTFLLNYTNSCDINSIFITYID